MWQCLKEGKHFLSAPGPAPSPSLSLCRNSLSSPSQLPLFLSLARSLQRGALYGTPLYFGDHWNLTRSLGYSGDHWKSGKEISLSFSES
uniref:Uncharacterized protein n=1 Tax=Fagus sylvatica TaxID=28930 RepID=A0A2N9HHD9_FAGSY